MSTSPKRHQGVLAAKCLVSLLFLGGLLWTLDGEDLRRVLGQADARMAAAGMLLSLGMVAASTWKWAYLLRLQGCPIPFRLLYRWYFVGYFYSNFLPSNVGGDVARSWLAGRHARAHGTVLVSIFAERFTGMLLLLSLAVLFPLLRPDLYAHPAVWGGALAGGGGLLLIFLIWQLGGWAGRHPRVGAAAAWLRHRSGAVRWDKWAEKINRFQEKIGQLGGLLRRSPRACLAVAALTVLYYALAVANVWLAFRVFGVSADLRGVAAVLPAALIVAMIPVTLGNLGIAEGSYVFYFGLVGLDGGVTLAMGLFLRLKILLLGVIGLVAHLGEAAPAPVSEGETP